MGELLSYGAVIASLGLFLAIWIRRPGRAIAVSVAALVLVAIGWLMALEMVIWPALQAWLRARYDLAGVDLNWLMRGLATLSPLIGPAFTLVGLGEPRTPQWKFGLVVLSWCLLTWAFAGALYWAALATFDRRPGRMRETSRGDGAEGSPCLVSDLDRRQNEDR